MAESTSPRCVLLQLLLVGVTAGVASGVTDGLLPNGNFEQGPDESQMNGTRVMGPKSIPCWETSGFVEYIKSGQKQNDMILAVPQGARAVRLGNDAVIRQQLTGLARHTYYSITFSAARTCAQAEKLNVTVTPESGVLPIQTVYSSSGWESYAWAFKAKHTSAWLSLHNPDDEDDPACGPLIDAIAIKTLHMPPRVKGNLLRNGGFEEGPYVFPDSPWGVMVPPMLEDEHSPLPGWTIMSGSKGVRWIDAAHFSVPRGSYALELVAGTEAAVVQEVPTRAGRTYTLSFSVGDARDGCEHRLGIEASAGQGRTVVPYDSRGAGGFERAELEFVASGNRTRVVFQSTNHHMRTDGALCGPVLDDVVLLPKPKHAARRLFM